MPNGDTKRGGKAVVLTSGGIDSATCLGIACNSYDVVVPVHFDYGQQTSALEQTMARRQCENMAQVYPEVDIRRTPVADYEPVFRLFSEGVANSDKRFGHMVEEDGRSSGYVPMRNLHLIATGAALADHVDADAVYHGAQAGDGADYPDCRPRFMDAAHRAVNESLPDGQSIDLRVPLLHLDKDEVLQAGNNVGVDWSATYSCYTAVDDIQDPDPCGNCPACVEREEAFNRVEFDDPYA